MRPTITVEKEDEHSDRLKKLGYIVNVDPAAFDSVMNRSARSPGSLRKGLYHFLDSLEDNSHIAKGTLYLTARAAAIISVDDQSSAHVDRVFTISNLVSRLSNLKKDGRTVNGSDLYSPSYDETERLENKRSYLEHFVMGKTIEVTNVTETNGVEWQFIDPIEFKNSVPPRRSKDFDEYLLNKFLDL